MPSNPKPVRMWGWTNADGVMCLCIRQRDHWPSDLFGGTRIRVTVVPDKKPARKRCNCNRVGLTTSDCGMFMDRCTNPKCKMSVKPAKKRSKKA